MRQLIAYWLCFVLAGCGSMPVTLAPVKEQAFLAADAVSVTTLSGSVSLQIPGKIRRPGAMDGVGEAAGASLSHIGEGGLIALPIMLPIGLVVGAAAAPDDDEWREIVARSEQRAASAKSLAHYLNGNEARDLFENSVVETLRSNNDVWSPCVTSRISPQRCQSASAKLVIAFKVDHRLRVYFDPGKARHNTITHSMLVSAKFADATTAQTQLACGHYVRHVGPISGPSTRGLAFDTSKFYEAVARDLLVDLFPATEETRSSTKARNRAVALRRFHWLNEAQCIWPR